MSNKFCFVKRILFLLVILFQTSVSFGESCNYEKEARCFIEKLFVKIDKVLSKNEGQDAFVAIISPYIDYDFLTKKAARTFFIKNPDITKDQYVQIRELLKKIINQQWIARAYNPHVKYRIEDIIILRDNYVIVKIVAKIPDGRIFYLNYIIEVSCSEEQSSDCGMIKASCSEEQSNDCSMKSKIKDLSIENVKVSEIYQDTIKSFVDSKNPAYQDMIDFLKGLFKKSIKK